MKNLYEVNESVLGTLKDAIEMAGFTYSYKPSEEVVTAKGRGKTMRISLCASPLPHGDFMQGLCCCCIMSASLTSESSLPPELEAALKKCNDIYASEETYVELGNVDDGDYYIGSDSPF